MMYCRSDCPELHEVKSPLNAVGITLSQITKDEWGTSSTRANERFTVGATVKGHRPVTWE